MKNKDKVIKNMIEIGLIKDRLEYMGYIHNASRWITQVIITEKNKEVIR